MRRLLVLLLLLVPAAPAGAVTLKPCGKHGFRCGRVRVPLDYDDAAGPTVSIAVTRLRARHHRIGTVFVNYGGPGAGAVATTKRAGAKLFRAYRGSFDIVAFDPRGTGESRPALDCRVDQERVGLYRRPFVTPATFDPSATDEATAYAARCAARNPELAAHVSTANVARDMDTIRAALGVDKVTYFGFSYGTLLGTTYASLFPDRVRAMVLDGPVDANAYLNDPLTDLRNQTEGFERALRRYFHACRKVCAWPGKASPQVAYDRLVRRANAHPLRVREPRATRGDRRPVDGDVLNFAISADLYAKQLWPEITLALDRARRGDGSLLRAISNDDYGRKRHGGYTPGLDRYFMIGASEQQFPRDPAVITGAGEASFGAAPHFFFNAGYVGFDYAAYEPRDENAYLGPFTLPAAAPTPLIVATTFDPATPYAGAEKLAAELGRSSFITMDGDGHTAYHGNSRCVDHAVDAYVLRLRQPREPKNCRQHVPFPAKPTRATTSVATAARVPLPVLLRRPRAACPSPLRTRTRARCPSSG